MRNDAILGDNYDAIADVVVGVIDVFGFAGWRNNDVISDARIFIHDGVLDSAILADPDARTSGFFVFNDGFVGFVVVTSQEN